MTDDEAEYSPFIVDGALARMEFSSYHGGGGKVYRRGGGRLHLMGDTSGRIWIWGGSSDPLKRRNGLWLLEKGTLRMLCLQDGLPGEANYSVAEDRQGGIWAGGKVQAPGRGGVARFFEGKWESWNLARVIPGEPEAHIVGCVRADPAEGVWASTEQGLARFRGGRWRNVPLPGGLFDRRPSGLRDHIYPYYTYDRQISNFWVSPLGWLWLQRRDARGSPRGFFLLKDDRWYVVRGRR